MGYRGLSGCKACFCAQGKSATGRQVALVDWTGEAELSMLTFRC